METNTVSQIFAQLTFSVKLVSIWAAVNFPFKSSSGPFIIIKTFLFLTNLKAFLQHLVVRCIANETVVARWISAKGLCPLVVKKI